MNLNITKCKEICGDAIMNVKRGNLDKDIFERQNHYSIRKLTVGTASVLLSSFFVLTNSGMVKAETTGTNGAQTTNQVNGQAVSTSNASTFTAGDNGSQAIDQLAKSNDVTLKRGDNSSRPVSIIAGANKDDEITVEVPYIFDSTSDRSVDNKFTVDASTQKVDKPDFETNKNLQNTTYTYKVNQDSSLTFNLNLTPNVTDSSLLPEDQEYDVVVKRNGQEIQRVKYRPEQASEFTKAEVAVDHNQTSNLVPNEKYPVSVLVENNGAADGDQALYSGNIQIDVPDGFLADLNNGLGLVNGEVVGDTSNSFNTNIDRIGFTSFTQAAAGQPIMINFDKIAKKNLNNAQINFFGSYTKDLEAKDNNFAVTIKYYATNEAGDRPKKDDQVFDSGEKNINLPVSDNKSAKMDVAYGFDTDKTMLDQVKADGSRKSDDPRLNYDHSQSIIAYNNGNVAQTNVSFHLDLEPGTVLAKLSNYNEPNRYGIILNSSSENKLKQVVATLTDGSQVVLATGPAGGFDRKVAIDSNAIAKGVKADGSNIKSIDIAYENIQAGTRVEAKYSNSSILDKKVNDQANYNLSAKSDQFKQALALMPYVLTVKDPDSRVIDFSGATFNDFRQGSYQATDPNGNTAKINYLLQNVISGQLNEPSSYLITIPKGFSVDPSEIAIKQGWDSTPVKDATLTDLGKIGKNGEQMFKVDLPITPYWGIPVWVGGKGSAPMTLTADKNVLPAAYNYDVRDQGLNGQELIYKLEDDNHPSDKTKEVTLADGKTYRVQSMTYGYTFGHEVVPNYYFTSASEYGKDNRIKGMDGQYKTDSPVDSPVNPDEYATNYFNYFDPQGRVAGDTGTIGLANVLTDNGKSDFSYNVINLPDSNSGVTLALTGQGTDHVSVTGTGNGKLLFSTSRYNGDDDYSKFVSADQITDWSSVKAILLQSDQLNPSATASAELEYKVVGMKKGLETASVVLPEFFWGNHANSSSDASLKPHMRGNLHLFVQRYVSVTTKWVNDDDNSELSPSTTQHVKAGDQYLTQGLSQLPKNLVLDHVDGQDSGVTTGNDLEVVYHYKTKKTPVTPSVDPDPNTGRTTTPVTPSVDPDPNTGQPTTPAQEPEEPNSEDTKKLVISQTPETDTNSAQDSDSETTTTTAEHLSYKPQKQAKKKGAVTQTKEHQTLKLKTTPKEVVAKSSASQLPQTGQKNNGLALFGLFASLAGLLGLSITRKKRD